LAPLQIVAAVAGVPAEVGGGVEREERLSGAAVGGKAFHRFDGKHLVVQRPHAVRHHKVLGFRGVEVDSVASFCEQVDCRRAVNRHVFRRKRGECRIGTV
jgi:hypothetical protein